MKKDRDIADLQRENFRKAVKGGARMVYGTDSGVYPHGDNARQFAWMVKYGMTPLEAIRSATLNAAEALGRDDVGVVEAGRYADLVGVKGDPLRDVAVLESVAAVVKGGEVIPPAR
jgi:imidazolonepropionase-like amidohydrolase